jgi:hypothetical protein
MKKFYLILLFFFIANLTFVQKNFAQKNQNISQNKNEWKWDGTVRFKPAQTIVNLAFNNALDIAVAWIPYVRPNWGIPVEFEIASIDGVIAWGLMIGVEGLPVRHREKSGLYLSGMIGVAQYISRYYGRTTIAAFIAKAHVGYQIVSKSGFVFTPAIGARYNTLEEGFALDLMIDIGFAYKKKK